VLSKASNFDQVFAALTEMLEPEEFACAVVHLGQPGRAEATAAARLALDGSLATEVVNGRLVWCWTRKGTEVSDVIESSDYWCFKVPLSTVNGDWGLMNFYRPLGGQPLLLDLNYLSGFLRRELSEAVERIINAFDQKKNATAVQLRMTAGKIAG
jgi:hypothetical protein